MVPHTSFHFYELSVSSLSSCATPVLPWAPFWKSPLHFSLYSKFKTQKNQTREQEEGKDEVESTKLKSLLNQNSLGSTSYRGVKAMCNNHLFLGSNRKRPLVLSLQNQLFEQKKVELTKKFCQALRNKNFEEADFYLYNELQRIVDADLWQPVLDTQDVNIASYLITNHVPIRVVQFLNLCEGCIFWDCELDPSLSSEGENACSKSHTKGHTEKQEDDVVQNQGQNQRKRTEKKEAMTFPSKVPSKGRKEEGTASILTGDKAGERKKGRRRNKERDEEEEKKDTKILMKRKSTVHDERKKGVSQDQKKRRRLFQWLSKRKAQEFYFCTQSQDSTQVKAPNAFRHFELVYKSLQKRKEFQLAFSTAYLETQTIAPMSAAYPGHTFEGRDVAAWEPLASFLWFAIDSFARVIVREEHFTASYCGNPILLRVSQRKEENENKNKNKNRNRESASVSETRVKCQNTLFQHMLKWAIDHLELEFADKLFHYIEQVDENMISSVSLDFVDSLWKFLLCLPQLEWKAMEEDEVRECRQEELDKTNWDKYSTLYDWLLDHRFFPSASLFARAWTCSTSSLHFVMNKGQRFSGDNARRSLFLAIDGGKKQRGETERRENSRVGNTGEKNPGKRNPKGENPKEENPKGENSETGKQEEQENERFLDFLDRVSAFLQSNTDVIQLVFQELTTILNLNASVEAFWNSFGDDVFCLAICRRCSSRTRKIPLVNLLTAAWAPYYWLDRHRLYCERCIKQKDADIETKTKTKTETNIEKQTNTETEKETEKDRENEKEHENAMKTNLITNVKAEDPVKKIRFLFPSVIPQKRKNESSLPWSGFSKALNALFWRLLIEKEKENKVNNRLLRKNLQSLQRKFHESEKLDKFSKSSAPACSFPDSEQVHRMMYEAIEQERQRKIDLKKITLSQSEFIQNSSTSVSNETKMKTKMKTKTKTKTKIKTKTKDKTKENIDISEEKEGDDQDTASGLHAGNMDVTCPSRDWLDFIATWGEVSFKDQTWCCVPMSEKRAWLWCSIHPRLVSRYPLFLNVLQEIKGLRCNKQSDKAKYKKSKLRSHGGLKIIKYKTKKIAYLGKKGMDERLFSTVFSLSQQDADPQKRLMADFFAGFLQVFQMGLEQQRFCLFDAIGKHNTFLRTSERITRKNVAM